MKKSTGAIILREDAADFGRVSAVLRGWGYQESEIRNFLTQQEAEHKLHERSEKNVSPSIQADLSRLVILNIAR